METIYGIYHLWQTDGGFGDAVAQEALIGVTDDEEKAKAYVERWSNPHVYDKPYDELHRGELTYAKLKVLDLDQDPELDHYW